jgi:cytidylate kinase
LENLFQRYLEESFRNPVRKGQGLFAPVVTISREYGCPSKLIGHLLVKTLNNRHSLGKEPLWHFINKEVIEEAARELNIPEIQVSSLLTAEDKGVVHDLITFSNSYGGSHRVRKTVEKVLRDFALRGHLVLVGRAGVAVLRDFPNSLHIKLHAPVDWRKHEISQRKGISEKEALQALMDIDMKRTKLIETILGRPIDTTLFDASFNCKYLTHEEIVQAIIRVLEVRKMA